ncbi:MAG: DUF115 domain-containing protein [Flavobacteriaceae bacterium]|nr:DUF115 domain-containing protein [Flavobacteriaceae bacterium]
MYESVNHQKKQYATSIIDSMAANEMENYGKYSWGNPDSNPAQNRIPMIIDKTTAFIIGTGPSLNKIDMGKLKGQKTITFNRAYVAFEDWGFDPTYYLAIDGNDIRSLYKDINKLVRNSSIERFFLYKLTDNQKHLPHHFQDLQFRSNGNIYVKSKKIWLLCDNNMGNESHPLLHDIETDGNNIHTGILPNAGFLGLKMLYHMGYRKIVLLGMDARYNDDFNYRDVGVDGGAYMAKANNDANHFRPDYFGTGITFGKPNQETIIHIWKTFMQTLKPLFYPELEIISCSEGSNMNGFIDYVPFDTIRF